MSFVSITTPFRPFATSYSTHSEVPTISACHFLYRPQKKTFPCVQHCRKCDWVGHTTFPRSLVCCGYDIAGFVGDIALRSLSPHWLLCGSQWCQQLQYISGVARVYAVAHHIPCGQNKTKNLLIRWIAPTGVLLLILPITCSSYRIVQSGQLPSTTSRSILCIASLSMLIMLTQITATGMIPNARNI